MKLRSIRDAIVTAVAWFAIGFGAALFLAPRVTLVKQGPGPAPVVPAPMPPPDRPTAAAVHAGHLTVSLIEPLYVSPSTAAIRHDLAAYDWSGLDTMFRAYTHGQAELATLGFTSHYVVSDLPIVFFQETLPNGSAPLVGEPIKPTSAAQVVDHVKKLRGH